MVILRLQALYYLFMGIWPLLHMRSFEAVTGPKHDTWLVRTIGWFFIVIGLQLWFAKNLRDIAIIGIGTALIVAGADAYYSLRGRISKIYLLDVVPQVLFIVAWNVVLR